MGESDALVVKDLYKVFGDDPKEAIKLREQGLSKDEIFEKTGMVLGVSAANFTVREGEIFVVMGLSGSGKSTLVRMLNRLITPSAGQIIANGSDIAAMSETELQEFRRKHIAMVFQSFALLPHLTVLQNAAFGLELSGVPMGQRNERARAALAQVGLAANENSYPNELSGGMQQRVGLARALANDPTILLMDEAFSALDPLIRSEMQDELLTLQAEHQRTVVFISHDLDEAMRIGDRIAIMEGGEVVQVGTPDEILNNPANDYVKSFFRGVNVSSVLTARDVARKRQVTVVEREGNLRSVLQRIADADRDFAYVVDKKQHFHGVVSVASLEAELKKSEPRIQNAFLPEVTPIEADTKIGSIIGTVAQAPCGLPVVDDQGRYLGVLSRALLLEALDQEGTEDA
ncbi:glycine betaine/L-proline ABC transporter ATP-binding protein ProV [Amorphus orientalis]|uniref:Quaternary amine transport ATP-binding protein n=1 Tax=Amorphus orientalis TaxID=649198 RepID=A0AAE4AQX3_9HYPH|nr:glycine betaine/L-proline ABC transporter ATP-binding protein ProV [Amorphus orientalis]MDQ0313587.1 glycine betaine/proline transport system ATP-binding protein [Amorphus orientalis]